MESKCFSKSESWKPPKWYRQVGASKRSARKLLKNSNLKKQRETILAVKTVYTTITLLTPRLNRMKEIDRLQKNG